MSGLKVRVSAPAHLHVGNIDMHGGLGRLYGTLGFAISEPRLVVTVERAPTNEVEGSTREDFRGYLNSVAEKLSCKGLRVKVESEITPHVGLGSTTPFVLAVGMAASEICGARDGLEDIALHAGRGSPSALGVYSFKLGGFIVDGGIGDGEGGLPPLIYRAHIRGEWGIVVALPEKPVKEVLKIKLREREILSALPRMSEEDASLNSRIVLMGILPSISRGDMASASRWIMELNRRLGERFWKEYQGGVYCCSEVEELAEEMLREGALGVAQSSWGPTVYGIARYWRALRIASRVRKALERLGGGRVWVTRVDNVGARIRVVRDG